MRRKKNIFCVLTIIMALLFFVFNIPLIPTNVHAQSCVDMELRGCSDLFAGTPIGWFICFLDPNCNVDEPLHCNCLAGYTPVTTALTSGCELGLVALAAILGLPLWAILVALGLSCPNAGYTTLCVGGP